MDLPPEIRETIFLFVLPDSPFLLRNFKTPWLAGVSKQLRRETLPLFFSECSFLALLEANLEDRYQARKNIVERNRKRRGLTLKPTTVEQAWRLGLKRRTTQLVKAAGEATRFRNVSFLLFRRIEFLARKDHDTVDEIERRGGCAVDAPAMSKLALRVNGRSGLTSKIVPGKFHPCRKDADLANYLELYWTKFESQDADAAMDDMAHVAKVIADREVFNGFSLEDLQTIAKGCRFVDVNQDCPRKEN